jgi:glucose/arabinose dehydrogenase
MRGPISIGVAVLLALCLAACGGGGDDGGGGGGGNANSAPRITSSSTATIPEGTSGTFYNAVATDADGDAVTFSLAGGADSAALRITAGGALSFATPPDFDVPGDANADNIYEVGLIASDGRANTVLTLRITVTDVTSGGFAVHRIATGLSQPMFLTAFPDGSGRVLVVERQGRIQLLNPTTGTVAATPFLDIVGEVSTDGERGLLSVALAPDFMTSGRAYIYMTAIGGAIEVRSYVANGAGRTALDRTTANRLLAIAHPRSNHNGGWLGFGRDGLLYISTGDGGGGNDPDGNGQNRSTLLGKMLRIDVSRDDFPGDPDRDYGIPAANPFATSGGAPEVWLYGLRNPFRSSFDRATGELWIADVGEGAIEEINRVRTSDSGLNMGWPLFEGTQPRQGTNPAGLTMPVTQYGHGSGPLQGNSITGGHVYRGPIEALQGLYIFADFVSGNIWSAPISSLPFGSTAASSVFTNRNAAFTPNAGSLSSVTGFGEDEAGNLYIVTIGGSVFAIRPSS